MALRAFLFVPHFQNLYLLSRGRGFHGMDWLKEEAAETYIP
jgi:hypothetical protein